MARRLGATDAQLDGLASADYSTFEPAWRAAFHFADALTPTPGIVADPVYVELSAHWSPAEIVEITSTICLFALFNRFAHALNIPITR